MSRVLDVQDLSVTFTQEGRKVHAVRGISFHVDMGETVALVGESGSGKSVSALSTVGLLPDSADVQGSVTFKGQELVGASTAQLRQVRGNDVSFIFQEPMTSLNPLHTIEKQITESLALHQGLGGAKARVRVLELLEKVGIRDAESRLSAYPHQLSGGQRQRVMIAMALANGPELLVADEPTTALDVTIQAQILDLMRRLQADLGMSILFITHDLGVVAEMADDVAVMYAGQIVERTSAAHLFATPRHPYTQGLLASIPRSGRARGERLVPIPGSVPSLRAMPPGCSFAPRCRLARPACSAGPVALREDAPHHLSRCILGAEALADA